MVLLAIIIILYIVCNLSPQKLAFSNEYHLPLSRS